MPTLFSQKELLKNVTKEDIWTDGNYPTDLPFPDAWKPDWWCAAQYIPWSVMQDAAKAVGQNLPVPSNRKPPSLRKVAEICNRASKQFPEEDIRKRWLNDTGKLLTQEAMIRAHAEAGLSLELPTSSDSAEVLRSKAQDIRERARKVGDEPLRKWMFDLVAKAEHRAMGIDAGLDQVATLDPEQLTEFERKNWAKLAPCKISFSVEATPDESDLRGDGRKNRKAIPKQSEPPDDGPVPPNSFCWKGKCKDGMTAMSWKVITFLWPRKNRSASDDDFVPTVWEETVAVSEDAVGSVRREANKFFGDNKFPWSVVTQRHPTSQGRRLVTLLNKPPQAANKKPRVAASIKNERPQKAR